MSSASFLPVANCHKSSLRIDNDYWIEGYSKKLGMFALQANVVVATEITVQMCPLSAEVVRLRAGAIRQCKSIGALQHEIPAAAILAVK